MTADDVFSARSAADRRACERLLDRTADAEQAFIAELVTRNRDTLFGKEHGFAHVRTPDDFRRVVPIHTYDQIAPWIERAALGEPSVLTAEPLIYFRKSSGSTGASKKLPVTAASQAADLMLFRLSYALPRRLFPELANDRTAILNTMFNGQVGRPDLLECGLPWGSMADELSLLIRDRRNHLHGIPGSNTPWFDPGELLPAADLVYFRLRMALESDLKGIVATNPSTIVTLARKLNESAGTLVTEIRDGTVFGRGHRSVVPNLARAKQLEQLLGTREKLTLADVWPGLKYVQTWKSGSCALYQDMLQREIGSAVILPFCYGASEGMGTGLLDDHPVAGFLLPRSVFFEFVPADQKLEPGSETLRIQDLAAAGSGEYHIVHTARNGLYRYSVGDVVRVLEVVRGLPRVEFVYRTGTVSSFAGEKLTEKHVVNAVDAMKRHFHLHLVNFTCCPLWGDPPRYGFIFEPAADAGKIDPGVLGRELDRQLALANAEYPSKRETGRLEAPSVQVVPRGTFDLIREGRADANLAALAQIKEKPLQLDGTLYTALTRTTRVRGES